MAYVPIDDADLKAAVAGNSAAWQALVDNDFAIYENYEPGFECNPYPAATTAAREFRLRIWNHDLQTATYAWNIGIRAAASAGTQTVYVNYAGYAFPLSVTTDAWYECAASFYLPGTPSSGPQEIIITAAAPSPQTLSFNAIRFMPSAASPTAGGLYASGFRRIGALWYASGAAVPSEVVSRLRTNPVRLAISRPVCVACHISDTIKTISTKSLDIWGVEDSTSWTRVGRLSLPRVDTRTRWYRCDAYTTETTPGTGAFSVRTGPTTHEWTGTGWHSWRVQLGAGPHEVWGNVKPGSSNEAAIRTLQIWRTEL